MNQSMSTTKKASEKTARSSSASAKTGKGFTAEERSAMKQRVRELKASNDEAEAESAVLEKIAGMPEPDRSKAKRIYAIIKAIVPSLKPKLWYGMPAFYQDGNLICHFQDAQKFKTRYATMGFSDKAHLDDGAMWPVAYALKELTAAEEARIAELVKKAVS